MVYPIAKLIITPIYKLWLRKVEGIGNAPKNKSFIIAANHASYYDAMLLHSILIPTIDKKIHALVNSTYWSNPINRFFLNLGECIPVFIGKDSKKKNKKALEQAIKYLKNKEIVQIFPEGTRSYSGKLKKAYNGIARLVLKTKAPVLPVGITGSYKVIPKGKIFPKFTRCEVKIGRLMYFEKYSDKKINKKILENITRKIMKEIARLIDQRYNY